MLMMFWCCFRLLLFAVDVGWLLVSIVDVGVDVTGLCWMLMLDFDVMGLCWWLMSDFDVGC